MSTTPIEHDKPLEARTYEQTSMLDAYLYFHYGDLSPVSYVGTSQDNTTDPSVATQTLHCATATHQEQPNYGEFGYLDQTSGIIGKPYGADFISTIPNFPKQVAEMAILWFKKINPEVTTIPTAIDIGCSVGRTCLDLAKYFPSVTGLDFSHLFVQTASAIADGKKYDYRIPIEGELSFDVSYEYTPTLAQVSNSSPLLNFIEGDACNLPIDKKYNCITGANLIDRLPTPLTFLHTLPKIVEKNGIVVLTSPYTWLEQYTPRSKWLPNLSLDKDTGDVIEGGERTQKTTFEALFTIMNINFELVHQSHIPFFIHETARKAQYSLAHCTVWRRRE